MMQPSHMQQIDTGKPEKVKSQSASNVKYHKKEPITIQDKSPPTVKKQTAPLSPKHGFQIKGSLQHLKGNDPALPYAQQHIPEHIKEQERQYKLMMKAKGPNDNLVSHLNQSDLENQIVRLGYEDPEREYRKALEK